MLAATYTIDIIYYWAPTKFQCVSITSGKAQLPWAQRYLLFPHIV